MAVKKYLNTRITYIYNAWRSGQFYPYANWTNLYYKKARNYWHDKTGYLNGKLLTTE